MARERERSRKTVENISIHAYLNINTELIHVAAQCISALKCHRWMCNDSSSSGRSSNNSNDGDGCGVASFFCHAIGKKSLFIRWSNRITKIDDIAESKYFHFTFELEFHQKCNTQWNVALFTAIWNSFVGQSSTIHSHMESDGARKRKRHRLKKNDISSEK